METTDPDIDVTGLKSRLEDELEADVIGADLLQDGTNLTVAISTERRPNAYVLRRPNPFRRIDYFSGLRREYGVLQQLEGTSVPAPSPVLFCDDESVIDAPFYVMTYLDGTATPWGSSLPEQYQNPAARGAIANRLLDTLAEIHTLDIEPFEGVCETLTPAQRVDRACSRLERATSGTGRELPRLLGVGDWLGANAPACTTTTLVHGDYKPDNVLIAETDPPRLAGVIDWEAATLCDPRSDLGLLLLFWRDEDGPTPSVAELEAAYPNSDAIDQLRTTNERGFWPFTSGPGSPTPRELVTQYERRTGVTFENERFYRALAPFTIATVWETFHRERTENGGDSHWEPLVDYMTVIADDIIEGRFEL